MRRWAWTGVVGLAVLALGLAAAAWYVRAWTMGPLEGVDRRR